MKTCELCGFVREIYEILKSSGPHIRKIWFEDQLSRQFFHDFPQSFQTNASVDLKLAVSTSFHVLSGQLFITVKSFTATWYGLLIHH
jgi:hypothetical protein